LINGYIHLFDQQTISWDSVSLIEVNDISNHQVLDWNGLNSPILSPKDCHQLFVYLLLELEELPLLQPVADTRNEAREEQTSVNGKRFDI
jgi:hypothetical protein